MVIIFGRRAFGRIEAHGGEHAQTSFAHVYYMPLVPVSSFWVTHAGPGAARGFEIRTSGTSILAAYLRSWAPLVAVIGFAIGGLGGIAVGAAAVAACVWAWSLRSLRGAMARRRSDFHLLAYGTRCDPARMLPELRARLKAELDARWLELGATRPPDDVATFGATSLQEALVAYGLLRLAAIERKPGAAAAAERILRGTHEPLPVGDGPYRGDAQAPASDVLAQVAAAATAHTAARVAAPHARVPWWQLTRAKAVVLGFIGMACLGGILEEGPGLLAVRHLDAAQLQAADLEGSSARDRFVDVRCDQMRGVDELTDGKPVYACWVGDLILPVVGKVEVATPRTVATGKLHRINEYGSGVDWPAEVRSSPTFYSVYLEVASPTESKVAAIICIFVLAVIAGIALAWARVWWKSRRRQPPNV